MNIEGTESSRKSDMVTIELLKQRSLAYRENPSIELYIEEVLEEQKEHYGYVSNQVKLKKKFEIDQKVCQRL